MLGLKLNHGSKRGHWKAWTYLQKYVLFVVKQAQHPVRNHFGKFLLITTDFNMNVAYQ